MNSTNGLGNTHGIETSMEPIKTKLPTLLFQLRPDTVARMREVTGAQPMDTAWKQFWKESETPWNAQGVTPLIAHLLQHNKVREKGKVLIPGCGTAYDAVAMASPTRRVTGLDISKPALLQA